VVGRPALQPPGRGGVRLAPRLIYSPEAESSGDTGERFQPWGSARLQRSSRRRRIPALTTEGGLSRVGISSRATMRQGVDQIYQFRDSGGCGLALPFQSPPAHGVTILGGLVGKCKMEEDTGEGLTCVLPTFQPCTCSGRRRAGAGAVRAAAPAVGGGRAGR
jgi:hypothetical protein